VLKGDSYTDLVFITSDGIAHKLPGYLFEDVTDEVDLSELIDFDYKKYRIIGAFSGDVNVLSDRDVVLATAQGLIKRTDIREFLTGADSFPIVKFRHETDEMIFAEILENPTDHVILVTGGGMSIRFTADSVSQMGRTAGGVQGISLKDEDRAVWGALQKEAQTLHLETNRGGKVQVDVATMKRQNRAGKGTNLIKMVLDELVEKVEAK